MPKWIDKTSILREARPELKNTQMFWASRSPLVEDTIAIVNYNSDNKTTLISFSIPEHDVHLQISCFDDSLDSALSRAEHYLSDLGFEPPTDNTSIEWSN